MTRHKLSPEEYATATREFERVCHQFDVDPTTTEGTTMEMEQLAKVATSLLGEMELLGVGEDIHIDSGVAMELLQRYRDKLEAIIYPDE